MKNVYTGLTEMMTILLNLDHDDTNRIKWLFDSIKSGEFYTKYSSITEMTQSDQLKKLAADLFTYYTSKKGKAEKEFYKNMKTLMGALYNNNKEDVKELLLYALSVSDEKKRYDLLKQILITIKDENVKNNIYLSIIGYSCATLKDYNNYLKRLVYGECLSLKPEQINKLISNWVSKIKQFVFIQDYDPEYFDSIFQEINGILIKLTSFYPDIAKNIRYICQIQPCVAYKQEHFKKVYSGADAVMSNITKEFLIMREQTKELNKQILSLKKPNDQQNTEGRIKTLEAENQKLRQTNQYLHEENIKLQKENLNLKLNLNSTNVLLENLKKRIH